MRRGHPTSPPGKLSDDRDDLAGPCVEITITWGASVLLVKHLSPPRSFWVGDREAGHVDFESPAEKLPAARFPVVLVEGDAIDLIVPEKAAWTLDHAGAYRGIAEAAAGAPAYEAIAGARRVRITRGSSARMEIGGLVIAVASTTAGRAIAGHYHVDKRGLPYIVGSGVAQLGLLAALSFFMPQSSHDHEGVSEDQAYFMRVALEAAEAREMEQRETEQVSEATADNREAGTGTRAKGEEGAMGNPSTKDTGKRFGVEGPRDKAPALARQEALANAAEFGMIGLLNSGAGGDPNAPTAPWGRDDSLGSDPFGARGNMWGNEVDSGSLGLAGVGNGGGGIGLGGIGTIGHGAGTGTGQGFGNGAGRLGGAHRGAPSTIAAPQVPRMEAPPPDSPIDPNGRFATTYRPGGGHLAAFESAVARGLLPGGSREIVSDVGARYSPVVDVPAGDALGARVDLERGKIGPGGGPFHLRLALRSSEARPDARPHLSVHLVLDVSGSMAGESITRAREAASALVDKLAPSDDFSLTTFSSDADVRVADGPVGVRRNEIKRIIEGIGTIGGTNIGAGLVRGYEQASLPSIPPDAVKVVLLVSDGRANAGITSGDRLSKLALDAFSRGIQTSSFGLGSDYDGALMSSIAADGAGGYYYLKSADQIAPALATELDKRLDPVATAVEVRVRLKPDVGLLRVYGSRRLNVAEAARARTIEVAADQQAQKRDRIATDRQDDAEGGMRFLIPAFARDDGHALLFKLQVPAGVSSKQLGLVEIKYKDRIAKKNVTQELPIQIAFADSDAASGATIDASVARTIQGFSAGEALSDAASRIARGDRAGAIAILEEREGILHAAASSLHEPLFVRDAARLARLRLAAGSNEGMGDPLVLSMLLETAGRSHLR